MAVPCPKCKADLPKGISECPSCGAKLKKKKKKKPAAGPDTGTTKRIVRKKSAIPSFDDSQVVATQKAEYEKYKKKEEAKPKKAGASTRRRKDEKAKLDKEREELEKEKRRLADEKRRLEEERELEEERARLEAEKARLEKEKKSRQAALEKKKQAAKSRRKAKAKPKAAPQPIEEDEDDLPTWDDEPAPRPKTPTKAPAKKSMVQQKGGKPASPARSATAVADEEVPAAVTVVKAETVGDWVDDIKGGINWKKAGMYWGGPVVLILLIMVLWGPGIAYGVIGLPKVKALPESMALPEPGGIPGKEPLPKPTHVWLPLGPLMVYAPKEGPVAVDWERGGQQVKFEERVVLYFRGWSIQCERYGDAALMGALDKRWPDSLLERFAGKSADQKLVKHCMELTPDAYSYLSGKGSVDRFKAAIQFKLTYFEEIKKGLMSVAYGGTSGYYFGSPGQGRQRIELFDQQGRRYSYLFLGGGPHRSQRVLKLSQPTQEAHWRVANDQLRLWLEKQGDKKEPFALFKAAMWAAGGSMGNRASNAQVDQVRSYLAGSPIAALGSNDDKAAEAAFQGLSGSQQVVGYQLMLRLMADPRKKVRERMRKYFGELMGYKIASGQTGIGAVKDWVEKKVEAAREKDEDKKGK